jgi:hypothetical protein
MSSLGLAGHGGSTETPAQLNLQRVFEQSRRGLPKRDANKAAEPAPGPPIKGKPRLLLMGQRRYVVLALSTCACI